MRKRTQARELALQFLYQLDLRGDEALNELDEFLKESSSDPEVLRAVLGRRGLAMSDSLGFQNTYALAVPKRVKDVTKISDIVSHPDLRIGLSHEFLGRSDGWPGLADHYGIDVRRAYGIDHGLAYMALEKGSLDVVDVYSTDPEINRYHDFSTAVGE